MATIVDLSIGNFVNVTIIGTPVEWGIPNVDTVALFSTEYPVNGNLGLYGVYKRPGDVAVDWGSSSVAYAIAANLFAQQPNPSSNGGYLLIIPLLHSVSTDAKITMQHLTFTAVTAGTSGNDINVTLSTGGTQGDETVVCGETASLVVVTGTNDKLDFDIGSTELHATIDAGTYKAGLTQADSGTLCAKIKDALLAADATGTYTVSYSQNTKKFTIARSAGVFNILWETGTNTATSIAALTGYSALADDTGHLTYTGDTVVTPTLDQSIVITFEDLTSTSRDIEAAYDRNLLALSLATVAVVAGYEGTVLSGATAETHLAGGDVSQAETIPAAQTRLANQIPYYCGVLVDQDWSTGTDFVDLCTAIQSVDQILFYPSATAADIEINGRFDLVRQRTQDHVRCLYRSTNITDAIAFAAAYAGRAMSTNYSGSNTTITMHGKQLHSIAADPGITQTILTKCQAAGVDVYQSFGGIPKLFTSGENQFFDYIHACMWLKLALQITGANYLVSVATKVPQTEAGMAGLKDAYRTVCNQAVVNGFVAPGSWTSADWFGDHEDFLRCITDIGYYVWSLPVTQQLAADRADRKAPLVQIAIKTAGAIHSSDVLVNVNI